LFGGAVLLEGNALFRFLGADALDMIAESQKLVTNRSLPGFQPRAY
jgi:hypothetical protein